jgi:ElaB/YqjD/DUF883 family membrane-anchored ribosome-binding protein
MDKTNSGQRDSSQTTGSVPGVGNRASNDPTGTTVDQTQRASSNQGAMGANPGQRPTTSQPGFQPSKPENLADQTMETVNQVVGNVQQEATRRMTDQIHFTREGLGSSAHAMRSASRELREKDQAMFAEVIDRAAEQIDSVANYLRDKDLDQIVHDSENFARRQPVLFVAGATMLGILAGRFLRSSSPRPQRSPADYQTAGYRGGLRALPGGVERPPEGTSGAYPMYSQFGAQRQTGTTTTPSGSNRPGREPEAGTGTTPGSTRS